MEEHLEIENEFYAGIIVDDAYQVKGPVLMFSALGGIDVEDIVAEPPETAVWLKIDILIVLAATDVKKAVATLDISTPLLESMSKVASGLYAVFRTYRGHSVPN